jgi:hypothetical protein
VIMDEGPYYRRAIKLKLSGLNSYNIIPYLHTCSPYLDSYLAYMKNISFDIDSRKPQARYLPYYAILYHISLHTK